MSTHVPGFQPFFRFFASFFSLDKLATSSIRVSKISILQINSNLPYLLSSVFP